jgi:hypothetical protein
VPPTLPLVQARSGNRANEAPGDDLYLRRGQRGYKIDLTHPKIGEWYWVHGRRTSAIN